MSRYKLSHSDMHSYGFKQGGAWAEDKRALERAFDEADRYDRGSTTRFGSTIHQHHQSIHQGTPSVARSDRYIVSRTDEYARQASPSTSRHSVSSNEWSGYRNNVYDYSSARHSPATRTDPSRSSRGYTYPSRDHIGTPRVGAVYAPRTDYVYGQPLARVSEQRYNVPGYATEGGYESDDGSPPATYSSDRPDYGTRSAPSATSSSQHGTLSSDSVYSNPDGGSVSGDESDPEYIAESGYLESSYDYAGEAPSEVYDYDVDSQSDANEYTSDSSYYDSGDDYSGEGHSVDGYTDDGDSDGGYSGSYSDDGYSDYGDYSD